MSQPNALITLKKRSITAVVAAITGLAITGVVALPATQAGATEMKMDNTAQMQTTHGDNQAAADLRVTMNNLLREHVSTSLTATRSIVSKADQSQIAAAEQAQYNNADSLAQAIGSIYGGEAQAQFNTLFKDHIEQSNKYAMATAQNDPAAKQMAQQELQEYLNQLATFFSSAIPSVQKQDVYGLLNEHEELINKSTEAYYNKDYVQSYQLEREALKQISRAADALSGGIIASMPEKY